MTDASRQALREYLHHKPECELLTRRAEYVTCHYCNGTGCAVDSKHQMKDIDGYPWSKNNCAPCAGNPDHLWLKYPVCTCGLDALLSAPASQPEHEQEDTRVDGPS